MAKTECRLKGYSGTGKENRKPLYHIPENLLKAFIGVFIFVFVCMVAVFGVHIYRKAPNTNIWGFPMRTSSGAR
jgi:hypothetical protein